MLPALLFTAVSLTGIGYGLSSIVDYLTPITASNSAHRYLSNSKKSSLIPRLSQYQPRSHSVEVTEMNHSSDNNAEVSKIALPGINQQLFIPFHIELGHLVSNESTGEDPDFSSDCPEQCLYLENEDKDGYTRYDFTPDAVLAARLNRYTNDLLYCLDESSWCETGLFKLDNTYLVINRDGYFQDFDKTNNNKSNVDDSVTRIPDLDELELDGYEGAH